MTSFNAPSRPFTRLRGLLTSALAAVALASCSDAGTSPLAPESVMIVALTPTLLSGTVGTPVSPVPAVQVTDMSGRPLAGVGITFEVTAGRGSLTGASTVTDAEGAARLGAWTLGTVASQQNVVRARLAGGGGIRVGFSATPTAGPVSVMAVAAGDGQTGLLGAALADSLSVKVMDRFGNPITGALVTFSPATDNGTIDASSATSNDAGIATSGTWTLGATAGVQHAKATAGPGQTIFTATSVTGCMTACPTGQRLVYILHGDVYTANADATGLVRLTSTANNSEPAWSPDGRRIAFVRDAPGFSSAIYIMDADGANVRLFASDAMSPAWSPDGTRLAYSAMDSGEFKIFIAAADGDRSPVRVGFTTGYNRWAAWSPDGSKLAFVSDVAAYDFSYEVYVMNADGSHVAQLTNGFFGNSQRWPSYTMYGQPAWSPDGRQIALVSCPAWQYASCDVSAISVMSADGSDLRTLVAAGGYARPAWSSDGKTLAYAHTCWDNNCSPAIYLIPASGGAETLLIPAGHSAAWRP